MNETIPFFQSWVFAFLCFVAGAIVGIVITAIYASSKQRKRAKEYLKCQVGIRKALMEMEDAIDQAPITKGKPDRE